MAFSKREKVTILAGAVIVAGILLEVFVVEPAVTQWRFVGQRLASKQKQVVRLRERLKERDSLVARRDELSVVLGSVLGSEAYPPAEEEPKDKDSKEKEAGPEKKDNPKSEPSKPDDKGSEAKPQPDKEPVFDTEAQTERDKVASAEKPGDVKKPDKGKEAKAPDAGEKKQTVAEEEEASAAKGVPLMVHVERTAKKSGVSVKQFSREKPTRSAGKQPQFTAVGLRLRFETQIQKLTKFLYALENGDRLVRIERMDMRRDLKKPDAIQVTLNVAGYEFVTGK